MIPKVEVVVLGLLAEGPLYGYELLERFRQRTMGEWVEVGKASVYQALRRLEDDAAVSAHQQDGTEGPDRRVFRIARSGRDRLRRGLQERLQGSGPYETDAGLALGFVHLLRPEEARRGIAFREQALRARRERLAEERRDLESSAGPSAAVASRLLELQDALAGTELAWLASVRRDLAKLRS
ncbi:MAG TPA: PadR family transcriptional regulator [Actinomycetota bacterium]